jgi:hypothetical protein
MKLSIKLWTADIPVFLFMIDSIDNVIGIFYTKEIIREFVKEKEN